MLERVSMEQVPVLVDHWLTTVVDHLEPASGPVVQKGTSDTIAKRFEGNGSV